MPFTGRFAPAIVALACLGLAPGCSQLDLNRPIPWSVAGQEEPVAPAKVVALWNHAVLRPSGQAPTQGFGGRLMFFGVNGSKPVRVEGSLVVYAFDEGGQSPGEVKPDRKFVFTPEQFAGHYSQSKLGHSYSVWLPWDVAGGEQKEISLIARFTPTEGPVIVGEQTKQVLPGESTSPEAGRVRLTRSAPEDFSEGVSEGVSEEVSGKGVRQAAYEAARPVGHEANDPADEARQTMDVSTISIPPRFGRLTPVARARNARASRGTRLGEASRASSSGESPSPAGQAPAATPAAEPAGQAPPPRPARFAPVAPRPPAGPIARSTPDRAPWQLRPVEWPSLPEPIRPAATASESE